MFSVHMRLCFTGNQTLKQHLKRHLGVKNYMCEHCSRSFVTKGDLNKHSRRHTGSTPYQCQLCQKKFTDISALYRHSNNIHQSVKQYRCKLCDQSFIKLEAARGHLSNKHGHLIDASDIDKAGDIWIEDMLWQSQETMATDYNNTMIVTINEPSTI